MYKNSTNENWQNFRDIRNEMKLKSQQEEKKLNFKEGRHAAKT